MKCKYHLCQNETRKFQNGRNAAFCSHKCTTKFAVTKKRRDLKKKAVELLGGKCSSCGYDKSVAALHFHHVKGDKEFGIAHKGRTNGWKKVVEELKKCVLICANCHAEEHAKKFIVG